MQTSDSGEFTRRMNSIPLPKAILSSRNREISESKERLIDAVELSSRLTEDLSAEITKERIEQLVLSNHLPHVIVDGEDIRFRYSACKRWVDANLIVHVKGMPLPETHHLVINSVYSPLPTRVPRALTLLVGNLIELPKMYLESGVYFLCSRDDVLYIGQSITCWSRICQHIHDKRISFDRAFILPCNQSQLNELEGEFIRTINPTMNRAKGPAARERGGVDLYDSACRSGCNEDSNV